MHGTRRSSGGNATILRLSCSKWRIVFGLYAIVLATLTHWPRLEMPLIELRSDLVVHMSAFGLWMGLFAFCGWFGSPLSRRNVLIAAPIAIVYSLIDEATQAIPGINRSAGLDDAAANALGVVVCSLVLLWIARRSITRDEAGGEPMTKG